MPGNPIVLEFYPPKLFMLPNPLAIDVDSTPLVPNEFAKLVLPVLGNPPKLALFVYVFAPKVVYGILPALKFPCVLKEFYVFPKLVVALPNPAA